MLTQMTLQPTVDENLPAGHQHPIPLSRCFEVQPASLTTLSGIVAERLFHKTTCVCCHGLCMTVAEPCTLPDTD